MSEAAIVPSAGINPNIPVGDEGKVSNRANSMTSFDDVDEAMSAPKPKVVKRETPKAPKEEGKPETKARGNDKHEAGFDDVDEKPAKKAEKPEKIEKPEKLNDDDDKALTREKDAQKPKAKAHKLKRGEDAWDIPGDAMVSVTVDGKVQEMEFQEALNRVSGETNYREKMGKLGEERQEFHKQRDGLNTMVTDLYGRVQKDPDAALDFLADLTKQDPIKLKEGILRKQIEQFKGIRDMSDEQVETWVKDQIRDWRDKHHESRSKFEQEKQLNEAAQSQRQELAKKYDINEEHYSRAHKLVHDYLKKSDPNFDGKVTPEQIIHADRHMMALETIREAVPHLEKRSDYDKIVSDIVPDLIRNPSVSRAKLAQTLTDVFGEDKEGLKKLSRKASETAKTSETRRAEKNADKDPLNFDDME